MGSRLRIPGCVAALILAGVAGAAERGPVQVRLVTDQRHPRPGDSVPVGALFHIAEGWHIYWKNPGDTGLATQVELSAPDGVEVGPLEWPLPERIVQAGDLVAYGYQGSVLLASELRFAPDLGDLVGAVAAKVSWLACKETCVLGDATLSLELPPPRSAVEAGVFKRWREELPRPLGTAGSPFELTVLGGLAAGDAQGELSLWLRWRDLPRAVELFPEAAERLKVSALRVRTRGDLTRIDMTVHVLGPVEDRARLLPAVVEVVTEAGDRNGYEVELPIDAQS